jgi:CheY-like chemotaxis protein
LEHAKSPPAAAATAVQAWVLVVEPDRADREALSQSLRSAGFLVVAVRSGEEALRRLPAHAWHAMVIERSLPGLDGFGITLRARAVARALPVVMTTHEIRRLRREQAQLLDGFLPKPLKADHAVEIAVHEAVVSRAGKMAREEMMSVLTQISAGLRGS